MKAVIIKNVNGFNFAVNKAGKVLLPTSTLYPYQLTFGLGLLRKAEAAYALLPSEFKVKYRFLEIIQDDNTQVYSIAGIAENSKTVVAIAEDIDGANLYLYVGEKIADRVLQQGFETFDFDSMEVTIPAELKVPFKTMEPL